VLPLEIARVVLREYSYDDWPTVLAYQSEPRYLRYYPCAERDAATVRDWIASLIDHQTEQSRESSSLQSPCVTRRVSRLVAAEFA